MPRLSRSQRRSALAGLTLAVAPVLGAQEGGRDYLFGRPALVLTVRGGVDRPLVNSGVFQFFTDNLLLSQRHFMSSTLTVDLAVPISSRLDLTASYGHSRAEPGSEFRRFIDNNDQPIAQTTTLRRSPALLSVRYFLRPRGEEISRLAWIPSRFSPYVGAGGGLIDYRLRQRGDFVDFATRDVFSDNFSSDGRVPAATAFAGAEWRLRPRLALSGELRYLWGRARLDDDFVGFPRADLSGVSFTTGLSLRL